MHNSSQYSHLLFSVFQALNIDAPEEITPAGFSVTVDPGIPVSIIPDWQNHLLFVSYTELPEMPAREECDLLWKLMDDNVFTELPHIQLGADKEKRQLVIWTQYPLSSAGDRQALITLFTRFIRRADEIIHQVNRYGQGQKTPGSLPSDYGKDLRSIQAASSLLTQRLSTHGKG